MLPVETPEDEWPYEAQPPVDSSCWRREQTPDEWSQDAQQPVDFTYRESMPTPRTPPFERVTTPPVGLVQSSTPRRRGTPGPYGMPASTSPVGMPTPGFYVGTPTPTVTPTTADSVPICVDSHDTEPPSPVPFVDLHDAEPPSMVDAVPDDDLTVTFADVFDDPFDLVDINGGTYGIEVGKFRHKGRTIPVNGGMMTYGMKTRKQQVNYIAAREEPPVNVEAHWRNLRNAYMQRYPDGGPDSGEWD